MPHDWLLYIAAFACAFAISLLATPYAKKIAVKVGAIDYPKKRGMHAEPIPRMGGLAIVASFVVTVVVLAPFLDDLRTKQFVGFLIGVLIIALVGILDDVYTLKPLPKLIFQVAAALVVIFTGTRVNFVGWPILNTIEPLSGFITLVWIVGVTNAVNLIDGLDGLAAGISSIGAICLVILCILAQNPFAVVLTAALAGSCMGFLPRNFSPAEVVMGDTGSLFLGFVLSVTSIMGVFKGYALLSIAIAFLVLALPIFDTLFAILRRLVHHKPIMQADRGHLHHRLIDAGYSHTQAVVLLYLLSIFCGVVAVLIAVQNLLASLIVVLCVAIILAMIHVYRKRTQ